MSYRTKPKIKFLMRCERCVDIQVHVIDDDLPAADSDVWALCQACMKTPWGSRGVRVNKARVSVLIARTAACAEDRP